MGDVSLAKPPPILSYCAETVKRGDPDRFLLGLFVPEPARETLYAVAALNLELAHIADAVTEETLGHIRHAWWQEAVDALYMGAPPRAQPVLQALDEAIRSDHLPRGSLTPLLDTYRAHFPITPLDVDKVMETIAQGVIHTAAPDAEPGWRRVSRILSKHRIDYGLERKTWLMLKLLIAGSY